MSTEIANPEETYNISPEALEIASTYLACHDTKETALTLGVDPERVNYYLRKPDVKRFIDTIFMEQGFMNRGKIQETMDKLFEIKLEEMEDTEMGTSKDILELLTLQHKMRMEEIKAMKDLQPAGGTTIKNQTNIQQNGPSFGTNLDGLVSALNKPTEDSNG